VEGFSTPRSNKRTAGLPNPCPIGLQSRCSILPGCPPVGLHQATAPHQTHTLQDPRLLGRTRSMYHWDSRPSATPDPSPEPDPHSAGIPALKPTAPWALLGPSYVWDDQIPAPRFPPLRPHRAPATCGMTGAPPRWDRHQLGVRQLHPPACRDPRPSGVARPQLYRLSR
jgi:hypothetical protein